jgi:hypothetical protein
VAHSNLVRPSGHWVDFRGTATWTPSTAWTLNQFILPKTPTTPVPLAMQCTTAGAGGATEPAWPVTVGLTVADGSAVWTAFAPVSIQPAELTALDANVTMGVNADGGTFAPTTSIVVGGSGITVTGPTVVTRGGTLQGLVTDAILMFDSDFPEYSSTHVGRSRSFMQLCTSGRDVLQALWRVRFSDAGMQSVSPQRDLSDGQGMQPSRLMVPMRVHDQSTLASVTIGFRVGFAHPSLPPTMPKARVVRIDARGSLLPLTSQAAGADAAGYVSVPTPSSVSAWQPSAGGMTLTISTDQNNFADATSAAFYVEIVDEQWPAGTGYPWQLVYKQPVLATTRPLAFAIVGLSTPVDGVTAVDGGRVLVNVGSPTLFTGIWVMHAGAWVRAADLDGPGDFSQGMVVLVDQGVSNGGSAWQVQSTTTSWQTGTQPLGVQTWTPGTAYVTPMAVPDILPSANVTSFWYSGVGVGSTPTTGTVEPAFPTTIGATIVDNPGANQITWTCEGPVATAIQFVPVPPTDDETPATAGTGFFCHGNIFQSVTPLFTGIADAHWQ